MFGNCFIVKDRAGEMLFGSLCVSESHTPPELVYFQSVKKGSEGLKVQCSKKEVEDISQKHAVMLNKSVNQWGGFAGANDKGLVIGVQIVPSEGTNLSEFGLTCGDLLRLALERCSSPREAVDCITALLDNHGYVGDAISGSQVTGSSFLLCDGTSAMVLEVAGSKCWAAKVLDGSEYVTGNKFSITTDAAKASGFPDGGDFSGLFNAATSEKLAEDCANRRIMLSQQLKDLASSGALGPVTGTGVIRQQLTALLGSRVLTTVTQVSVLPATPGGIASHWLASSPAPERLVFKPFVFVPGASLGDLVKYVEDKEPALWVAQRKFTENAGEGACAGGDKVSESLKALEEHCMADLADLVTPDVIEATAPKLATILSHMALMELNFYK